MNRYGLEGMARDVAAGKSVLLVSVLRRSAVAIFRELAGFADWQRVRFTNGREHLTHWSGGRLDVVAAGHALRGRSPDVLIIEGADALSVAQEDELRPLLATGAEVVMFR
ncbi:hypothetical protein [Georgenia sp. MJ170]|uniref:hypothetical protein n=1 Tax=Georgenia sunbinii TaxID=3117728 RepID=UPI002F269F64